MSNEQWTRIGVYLRVYWPLEEVVSRNLICSICGGELSTAYCPRDGGAAKGKITSKKEMTSGIYEFCQKVYNYGDAFTSSYRDEDGTGEYEIVHSNMHPCTGLVINRDDEDQELEMPPNEFTPDWLDLMSKLDEQGIKYKKCYGIVVEWF